MLEASFCRTRQQRLLRAMYAKNIGAVVLGWRSHVYYFTGHWPFWQHQAAFVSKHQYMLLTLERAESNRM